MALVAGVRLGMGVVVMTVTCIWTLELRVLCPYSP